ncbi:MAG: ABC transporter permease [Candidatus Dormibacteria bacterium]
MIPLLFRRAALARLGLGVAALALGGGAVLGIQLASSALQRQSLAAIRQSAGAAQYDIIPFSRPGFSPQEVAAVTDLPAVSEVAVLARKADLAELPSGGYRQVVLVEVGPHGVALRPLPLLAGTSPTGLMQVAVSQSLSPGLSPATGQLAAGSVLLGGRLALTEAHGIQRFSVVGLVADSGPGAPFTNDAVYVTQAAAQRLFSSGLEVTDIAVRLGPGETRAQLMAELPKALHSDFTVSDPRSVPGGNPVSELQPLLDGITALSLLLALALITATFSAVVIERRREIGLVRLAGASRTVIFRSFAREALAAACLGAVLGVGVGYLLAAVLVAISNPAGQSPAASVTFQWQWTLAAFLLVVVLGMAAAVVPAVEAAMVSPLDAVRPSPRRFRTGLRWWLVLILIFAAGAAYSFSVGGGVGVAVGALLAYLSVCTALAWLGPALVTGIGSFVGVLLAAPVAAVSARSRSHPGRTALALGSLFVTVATAAGLAGLSAAALQSGGVWVNRLFVGNYLVVSPTPQTLKIEQQVVAATRSGAGSPHVGEVAPVRFVSARVGHIAVALAASSPQAYSAAGALQFVRGNRASAMRELSRGAAVVVPLQLAAELRLRLGQRLSVVTSSGTASFTVAGVVQHTLPGPAGVETVLVSQVAAVRAFGGQASGFDLLQMEVTGAGSAHAVDLAGFRYGMETESVAAVRRGVDRGIQHDIAAIAALALVGVVIAILAAVNTVVLETREATRDLALLRVVGLSRAAVSRAVIGEALATALVGCGLGILGGVALIWPEVQAASSPSLPLPFAVSGVSLVALGLAAVIALLLAAAVPARQLGNLDPVAALAVE